MQLPVRAKTVSAPQIAQRQRGVSPAVSIVVRSNDIASVQLSHAA